MTDYEKLYQADENVCGAPFPEFIAFFEQDRAPLLVLDLGCGQGRDALMIARQGHQVVGVDIAQTGVAQMLATAQKEGLAIEGVVQDLRHYTPDRLFDVVVLDRMLHMLKQEPERMALLSTAMSAVKPGGYLLIADTPSNKSLITNTIENDGQWQPHLVKKNTLFYKRTT